MMRDTFLDAAGVAAGLLRAPQLAARWAEPSALPDFSTGGLARHLGNQISSAVKALSGPSGTAPIPVLEHFTRNAWMTSGVDSDDNRDIRRRGEASAAATSAEALAGTIESELASLRATLPDEPADRVIDLGDWSLRLDDFLLTRVLELVVHSDDLAVGLGVATPAMPTAATDATIALLAQLATWRHGPVAVVRTLARRERAPATVAAL